MHCSVETSSEPATVLCAGLHQPEGPVVLPDGSVACVEMAEDHACLTRITPAGQRVAIVKTGGRPNGLTLDGDGALWAAGGPAQRVSRYSLGGQLLTEVEGETGRCFLFPNDLAFGPDGALYMTDSGWPPGELGHNGRIRGDFRTLPYDGAVIRIDPITGRNHTIRRGLKFANGIAFSPHGRLLVNESATGDILEVDGDGEVRHYANVLDGCETSAFGPDGMAFAADGTLYCAVFGAGHIAVIPPGGGAVIDRIDTPGRNPSNLAFARDGSPVIFVTEVEHGVLLRVPVDRPGLALHEPAIFSAATTAR